MPTPYDLRRQLWDTAREQISYGRMDDDKLDELVEALMADIQSFVLAKLGLAS